MGTLGSKMSNWDVDAAYQAVSQKGQANGYASLGADGKVPSSELPASQGGGGAGQLALPIAANAAAVTWTNMPLAATFWNGSHRHVLKADLSSYTQARLVVNKQGTAGAAASKLILRYRTTFSATVGDYSDIGTSEVSVAVNVQNSCLASNWINLAAGAIADVFIAVVGSGGDGALDPIFGSIVAQFK